MELRTVGEASTPPSYVTCERLLAELVDDIAELDLSRRDSRALSTCVNTLEHALVTTSRLHGTSLEILDYLAFGTGVLDETATLLQSNRYLDEVIEAGEGLCLSGGRLRALRPSDTRRLQDRITAVAEAQGAGPGSSALTVSRPSGLDSLLLVVAPVREHPLKLDGKAALLFVADPHRSTGLDSGLVKNLFGLTRTESRIATRLARGMRLDDVAASLGVAVSTARTHLKHIFSKTHTERQAELTVLLRGLLGSLRV